MKHGHPPMNKTMRAAQVANKNTLDSLTDLLRVLNEAGAIVGRDDHVLILYRQRLPKVLDDGSGRILQAFMDYSLDGNGGIRVFSPCSHDGTFVIAKFGSLNIDETPSTLADGSDSWPASKNDDFPYVEEVRALIRAIPELNVHQKTVFHQIQEGLSRDIREMFGEHRDDIIAGLFSTENDVIDRGEGPLVH